MTQPKLTAAITIRCTKEELRVWKTKAKAERKSRSKFIRDRANSYIIFTQQKPS